MTIANKTVLVTGANRGIGQALVEEALKRGAKQVYAAARQPIAHSDARVTSLILDVTDTAEIQAAAASIESLDILVNNAGVQPYDDLSDRAALEESLAVNLFGPYGVTQAFLPLLTRSQGAIVNNLSMMAFAPLPLTPAYAVSKAAAFNLTQSLRALLAGRGVRVHAVLTGPTDTDMTRGFEIPKASPQSVRGAPPSSTAWRTGRRTSSPIRCRRRSPRAGAAVRPRRSSLSMRRSSRQRPSRHEQTRCRHAPDERQHVGDGSGGGGAGARRCVLGRVAPGDERDTDMGVATRLGSLSFFVGCGCR